MEICKYRVVVVHNNQISVNPNYTYVHRSTITTLQTQQHTSSHLPTFSAEKEVCDVSGVVDADADADDEHRRGDRVYRQI